MHFCNAIGFFGLCGAVAIDREHWMQIGCGSVLNFDFNGVDEQ